MGMDLDLRTYITKPENINVEDYTTNHMLNTNYYVGKTIVDSGAFNDMINIILKDIQAHKDHAKATLKLKQHQMFNGPITESELDDVRKWAHKLNKTLIKDENNYKNLTPNAFLDMLKDKDFYDYYINRTIDEFFKYTAVPLYKPNDEHVIYEFFSNELVMKAFNELLDDALDFDSEPLLLTPKIMHQLKSELEKQIQTYKHNDPEHVDLYFTEEEVLKKVLPALNLDTYYLLVCC